MLSNTFNGENNGQYVGDYSIKGPPPSQTGGKWIQPRSNGKSAEEQW